MRQDFQPTVYLLTNRKYGALYVGVTSNLLQRISQHRDNHFKGFSSENGTHILIWFEQHATMESAIIREKRIKNWNRQWKINLVEMENPDWRDVAVDLGFPRLMPQPYSRFGA